MKRTYTFQIFAVDRYYQFLHENQLGFVADMVFCSTEEKLKITNWSILYVDGVIK